MLITMRTHKLGKIETSGVPLIGFNDKKNQLEQKSTENALASFFTKVNLWNK